MEHAKLEERKSFGKLTHGEIDDRAMLTWGSLKLAHSVDGIASNWSLKITGDGETNYGLRNHRIEVVRVRSRLKNAANVR